MASDPEPSTYWDQASVLVQLGLLGREGLPVVGVESAHRLLARDVPSRPF
jgi:carboxymethylenebutenolidase